MSNALEKRTIKKPETMSISGFGLAIQNQEIMGEAGLENASFKSLPDGA